MRPLTRPERAILIHYHHRPRFGGGAVCRNVEVLRTVGIAEDNVSGLTVQMERWPVGTLGVRRPAEAYLARGAIQREGRCGLPGFLQPYRTFFAIEQDCGAPEATSGTYV